MFTSQTLKAAGTLLNSPTRHGVPRGSNRRTGARPVGQRWRKWSHHHLLLIGQIEEARVKEATDHAEVKRREAVGGLGDMGPQKERLSLAAASVIPPSTPYSIPFPFIFTLSCHDKGFHSTYDKLQKCQHNTTNKQKKKKKKKNREWSAVCVCVYVFVWKSSTWRRFGLLERDQCCVRCVWAVDQRMRRNNRRRAREAVKSFHWWDSGLLLLFFCTECILEADVSVLRTGWMSESSVF